jgi:hypothetical protein
MKRSLLCLGLVVAAAACSKSHACREGTVFVTVEFLDGAQVVDGIEMSYQLNNSGTWTILPAISRPLDGEARGGLQLEVINYTTGSSLRLRYTPMKAGKAAGAVREAEPVLLEEGCTAMSMKVALSPPDAGVADASAADAGAVEGGVPDRAATALLKADPGAINFESVKVGDTSIKAFTVTYVGSTPSDPLVLSITDVSGSFGIATAAVDAGVGVECRQGMTLAPNASCTVHVSFKPGSPGNSVGFVNFSAGPVNPGPVTLSGTGI